MTAAEQASVFAAMAACGAALGMIGDVLSPLRRGVAVHVLDIMMGVTAAGMMTLCALRMRTDVFRLYVFAGAACGFAIYSLTLGTIVRKLAHCVRSMNKKDGRLDKKVRNDAGKQKKSANV